MFRVRGNSGCKESHCWGSRYPPFNERGHRSSFLGRNPIFGGRMQTTIFDGGSSKSFGGWSGGPPFVGIESAGLGQQPPLFWGPHPLLSVSRKSWAQPG